MEGSFEIAAISNRYKDTIDHFIDSSNIEFFDWPRLIDKGLCNRPISEGCLIGFSKGDYLNEDISNMLLRLTPKT